MFEPHTPEHRHIYQAFQKQAKMRDQLSVEHWIDAERQAVFQAAVEVAGMYNMHAPTLQDVEKAESQAMGHVDYGKKWTIGIIDRMKEKSNVA